MDSTPADIGVDDSTFYAAASADRGDASRAGTFEQLA